MRRTLAVGLACLVGMAGALAQPPNASIGEAVPRDVRELYDKGLQYLVKQLQEAKNNQNLDTFVVDRSGRLVASSSPRYATGQDMNANELVRNFVEQKGKVPVAVTMDYPLQEGKNRTPMLGT